MAHLIANIKEWGFAAGIVAVAVVALIVYLCPQWVKDRYF
jgi:hypothetical protein